jgi:hypothetical protein
MRTAGILVVGMAIGMLVMYAYQPLSIQQAHEKGFKEGHKVALTLTPVSHELEMVCAGLWFGGKGEEYWRNKWAKQ